MTLKLFDSKRREKLTFRPLHGKTVSMYVCGVTPYDTTHLGHASTFVFFDALQRYLELRGYRVRYVQNITDIDDDILKRARDTGTDWKTLGDLWTARYMADMERLNVRGPMRYARATDFINGMAGITRRLVRKGLAYESGRATYFDTAKSRSYGSISRLSGKQRMRLLKEREENPDDPNRKKPEDFELWLRSRHWEPSWDTVMGRGMPGWHIECATIINSLLGPRIDIQGGGRDLLFPHHEDTAAVLDALNGSGQFATYFMHTGMLLKGGKKMSKSLGNLVMLADLFKHYTPNAIRWMLLSHHYRSAWEFDRMELEEAGARVESVEKRLGSSGGADDGMGRFIRAMDDDMDTPGALRALEQAGGSRSAAKMFRTLGFA